MLLEINKKHVTFRQIDINMYCFDYNGSKYYLTTSTYRRIVLLKSPMVKLLVHNNKQVIAVYSSRYQYIDNSMLDDVVETVVPEHWLLDAKFSSKLVYYARYVVPDTEVKGKNKLLFVVSNVNDGSTALRVYYGVYVLKCSNGLLSEEIALALRRIHVGSEFDLRTALQDIVSKYQQYAERIERYVAISVKHSYDIYDVERFLNVLVRKRVLTKTWSRSVMFELYRKKKQYFTAFEIANALTNLHTRFKELYDKPLRLLRIERIAGKIVANPDYVYHVINKGVI